MVFHGGLAIPYPYGNVGHDEGYKKNTNVGHHEAQPSCAKSSNK